MQTAIGRYCCFEWGLPVWMPAVLNAEFNSLKGYGALAV
jgi:hypothetical protein